MLPEILGIFDWKPRLDLLIDSKEVISVSRPALMIFLLAKDP